MFCSHIHDAVISIFKTTRLTFDVVHCVNTAHVNGVGGGLARGDRMQSHKVPETFRFTIFCWRRRRQANAKCHTNERREPQPMTEIYSIHDADDVFKYTRPVELSPHTVYDKCTRCKAVRAIKVDANVWTWRVLKSTLFVFGIDTRKMFYFALWFSANF